MTAAIGLFWGAPISVFAFAVFLKPLMHDFNAGRAAISLGYTLHGIAAAISAPLAAWLIDRYGSRRVILVATALFGTVLLCARLVSPGPLSEWCRAQYLTATWSPVGLIDAEDCPLAR